ncbi:response regulator [Novosphingopyxis iocasae]|uniref:response regulator n=1 Tax=Novosphingopyxis iocasae TaxID=2762729 RepID=UPI001651605B|nr:response regulator [Novosphingopyxis iocasae]
MTKPLHLLYVDDDPDIRTIIGLSLEMDPAIIAYPADSGEEALNWLASDPTTDAIMIDIMMPTMDGMQLLSAIREREAYRHTPVIVMTAKGRSAEVDAYRRAGASGVIIKPFDPLRLANEVRAILDDPNRP